MERYDDVRLVFEPGADPSTARVLAIDQAVGAHAEGTFAAPVIEPSVLQLSSGAIGRDVGGRSTGGPVLATAREVGGRLAAALLHGDVGALYEGACRRVEGDPQRGVRLSLALTRTPDLLGLPWELLYVRPRFLASQQRTPIVRVVEGRAPAEPPVVGEALRVLAVIASPRDLPTLDVAAERRRVEQAIAPIAERGLVEVTWVQPATPAALRAALRDATFHVVHFIGHSDLTASGEGILLLEDAAGASVVVDETLLANLLGDQLGTLGLVVLNSCHGARSTPHDPQAGVAATLMGLGVPAVVAMQFRISDAAAIAFASELYTNLIGRRRGLDVALAEARKAIYTDVSDLEWATPVLFVQQPGVAPFRFAVSEEEPMATAPPSASAVIARLVQDPPSSALWEAARAGAAGDAHATEALRRLAERPDDARRAAAAEGHVEELLERDPAFARTLAGRLDEGAPRDRQVTISDAGAISLGGDVTITSGGHAAGRDLVVGADAEARPRRRWGRR